MFLVGRESLHSGLDMVHDIQAIYAILLAKGYQEQFFSDLGGVRKKEKGGRETLVTCPFCHKERHFSYNRDKPLWRCWHCGETGDWIAYLKKTKGLDFKDAVLQLAQVAGFDVSHYDQARYREYTSKADILESAQSFFIKTLKQDIGRPVKDYLLNRGYSEADIDAMQVGAYPDKSALQKHLKSLGFSDKKIRDAGLLTSGFGDTHTLIVPWEDPAGRMIGIVGRTVLPASQVSAKGIPKYKYSAGLAKSEGLIGFSGIRGAETIVLVEGVLDARYLNSKGFKTASIGGTDLSLVQIRLLELSGAREVLLAFDMDEAGREGTARAADLLSRSSSRPYVVSLPGEFKDPDELVRAQGREAFETALKNAERWPSWHARHICHSHDITTDRGLDSALLQAATACARLDDVLYRRFFLDSLRATTGLTEEELSGRLQRQEQVIAQQRVKGTLQTVIQKLQRAASDCDSQAAECDLEHGLQTLRVSRAEVPEPYLLEDFEQDLLRTPDGLKTGYPQLDAFLRIPQGALSILAGRPGHGKTTLQLNLLLNFLRQYPDQHFYLFSYEEARIWLALKLIMILAGEILDAEHNQAEYMTYLRKKRGRLRSFPAIDEAVGTYSKLTSSGRLTIVDRRPCAEDLASTLALVTRRENVGAILIDYIQKIPLRQPLAGQRYQEIKRVSELMLGQAVTLGVPILLGAQLGRSTGTTNGKARVRLDNLRESGDIEQDAAVVLGIYNPSADEAENDGHYDRHGEVELNVSVLKNRAGVQAKQAHFIFHRSTLRVLDQQQQQTGATVGAAW